MHMASSKKKKVRYAVVGLGHIAQVAVLPGLENSKNSELAALVSNDPTKLAELAQRYGIDKTYSYEQYEQCLGSGDVDAVYIALPNDLHCQYTVRAAQAGVHVLCEKPMAVTEDECRQMIEATRERGVKLMIAYRLHFEEANLKAVEIVQSGQIGAPRIFTSLFNMLVKDGDIRVSSARGGGTLYDIGVYCINAARYLFQSEPTEVFAASANSGEERFREVDEMSSVIMRFPEERLASFTASFGAADVSAYRVAGTKGDFPRRSSSTSRSKRRLRNPRSRSAINSARKSPTSRSVFWTIPSPSLRATRGWPMCGSFVRCTTPRRPAGR